MLLLSVLLTHHDRDMRFHCPLIATPCSDPLWLPHAQQLAMRQPTWTASRAAMQYAGHGAQLHMLEKRYTPVYMPEEHPAAHRIFDDGGVHVARLEPPVDIDPLWVVWAEAEANATLHNLSLDSIDDPAEAAPQSAVVRYPDQVHPHFGGNDRWLSEQQQTWAANFAAAKRSPHHVLHEAEHDLLRKGMFVGEPWEEFQDASRMPDERNGHGGKVASGRNRHELSGHCAGRAHHRQTNRQTDNCSSSGHSPRVVNTENHAAGESFPKSLRVKCARFNWHVTHANFFEACPPRAEVQRSHEDDRRMRAMKKRAAFLLQMQENENRQHDAQGQDSTRLA